MFEWNMHNLGISSSFNLRRQETNYTSDVWDIIRTDTENKPEESNKQHVELHQSGEIKLIKQQNQKNKEASIETSL